MQLPSLREQRQKLANAKKDRIMAAELEELDVPDESFSAHRKTEKITGRDSLLKSSPRQSRLGNEYKAEGKEGISPYKPIRGRSINLD